ncbi:MAG: thioredoxin domain-containing protein [Actinomycetota bacterium]|nr:thioredoxin domain-containing protein [Actinomycetota bacterium]
MTNRLAQESSPYLLQHKDNPVDWYSWGNEAFEVARREDKPILLSIGYAACHWCHVMERESFEDPDTAALMNDLFVCIKVDREERPDVDSVYMEAVQAMTGHGGWPMTVFLTPDGSPFYGGTYFPPDDRHGMPSFRRLLAAVSETWIQRRSDVDLQGRKLVEHIGATTKLKASTEAITDGVLHEAVTKLERSFDAEYGGFGAAPKFPQPMTVDFLLRMGARGKDNAMAMALKTLDAMASGGMFDQLGGGFARYSVDRHWIVPHFEKMLYDNAQLLRTYARSHVATGSSLHLSVAEATAGWLLAEMRDSGGGFWASMDADSEGEEGKFYTWTLDEVRDATGDDADAAVARWGFTEDGNFEGLNIPVRASEGVDDEAVERARVALLERRSRRVRPETDTKVLTAWSCLTASALAEAGAVLDRSDWISAAEEAIRFTLDKMRPGGRLMRSFRQTDGGESIKHLAYSEDYALLLEACLALYEATYQPKWLKEARWAADEAIRLFLDDGAGGFFTTGVDSEALVSRPKELMDNAVPTANSILALELQRLALFTGERLYEDHAVGAIRLLVDAVGQSPQAFGHLLQAIDFYTSDPAEIVILGEPDPRSELVDTVRGRFIPNKILIVAPDPTPEDVASIPLLEDRAPIGGRATAYVCHRGECKLPVTTPEALLEQLDAA